MYFQPESLCPKYWGTVIITPKGSVMRNVDIVKPEKFVRHFNMLVEFHVIVFGISYELDLWKGFEVIPNYL